MPANAIIIAINCVHFLLLKLDIYDDKSTIFTAGDYAKNNFLIPSATIKESSYLLLLLLLLCLCVLFQLTGVTF